MDNLLILHDLPPGQAEKLLPADCTAFAASPAVKHCIGCFGCWVKTPGVCVLKDRATGFAGMIAKADRLAVVSRCVFGGLSPDVKAVMDRSIGYILPYFYIVGGEMHHVPRYEKQMKLDYIMYGDTEEDERQTALKLIECNAINLNASSHSIKFCKDISEVGGALQ